MKVVQSRHLHPSHLFTARFSRQLLRHEFYRAGKKNPRKSIAPKLDTRSGIFAPFSLYPIRERLERRLLG